MHIRVHKHNRRSWNRAMALLARGVSRRETARITGIPERTLYNRLRSFRLLDDVAA
jgi:hypothetical protein